MEQPEREMPLRLLPLTGKPPYLPASLALGAFRKYVTVRSSLTRGCGFGPMLTGTAVCASKPGSNQKSQ